jgi:hypothetical protein
VNDSVDGIPAAVRLYRVQQRLLGLLAEIEAMTPSGWKSVREQISALTREAWLICRHLAKPQRHLACLLNDIVLNQEETPFSTIQLAQLREGIALLTKKDLTAVAVAEMDVQLLAVGLNAIPPISDELVALYG